MCFQRMLVEELGAEEFKGTIHVSHMDTKHPTDEQMPTPRVEFAQPRVLTIDAIANDRIVAIDKEEEGAQVMDVELSIGIHKKREFLGRRCKAAHQGCAIALVDGMGDETNTRITSRERSNNCFGLVCAAIVDDDAFKIYCPGTQYRAD